MDLNYKEMGYKELIRVIDKCQGELHLRGILNKFCTIDARNGKIQSSNNYLKNE